MGYFSWKTQDTNRSISNCASGQGTFKVFMTDDKGNKFEENDYEGYGVFGGKDYFILLFEMNNKEEGLSDEEKRNKGINLYFSNTPGIKYPSLSQSGEYFMGKKPEDCEFQGFFYPEEDTDDEMYEVKWDE
jgi:hypothetical protein